MGTTLRLHEIAARVGVCRDTVSKLRRRHGWTRPPGVRASRIGQPGGGFVPEVVAGVRALVEGTTLSETAIAARTGVGRTTISRWRKRRDWRRPAEAPTFLPKPRADGRARPTRYRMAAGQPYAADVVGQCHLLLTRTLLSQGAIADRLGVSKGWVGRMLRRRGWTRPPIGPGSKRFAASRRTGPLEEAGDRRGRPYAAATRKEARAMWELTRLPTSLIGSRVGAHPVTVARWAREEAWIRPHGRAGRAQLRGFFGAVVSRGT